jgi:gliding motility-associated-like protein
LSDGTGVPASGTGCATIVEFDIFVPIPTIVVSSSKEVICVDSNGVPLADTALPVLTATAGPEASASYEYQWLLNDVVIPGATSETYTVTTSGSYSVTVSGPTDFQCINTSFTQVITESGSPDNYNASVTTEAFAESHQVVATATSVNTGIVFWYSLDDGEATNDGVFTNVSPGLHTVTITDGAGCWSYTEEVVLVDYPKFFTPNGDGINDTWSIIEQQDVPISQIYIFDRFGKLLKQLDPDGSGWDGMYNGNQMPATDYWFKIIYIEGADSAQKEFKAHFSLKR